MELEFYLPRIRVRIRPATEADGDGLEWIGAPDLLLYHEDRIEEQANGAVLYLIAAINDRPVGCAVLRWHGRQTASDYPNIEEMEVAAPLRGFGVGTALIEACEQACRAQGVARIGIVVKPVLESDSRALYERLGYRFAGQGLYLEGIERPDDPDEESSGTNLVMEMVKELTP